LAPEKIEHETSRRSTLSHLKSIPPDQQPKWDYKLIKVKGPIMIIIFVEVQQRTPKLI